MSEPLKVVIVGAVACGAKAAARIRRLDPKAQIVMIDQGEFISFAGCGLPYFIEGKVKEYDDLIKTSYGSKRDSEFFAKTRRIDTRTRTRAVAIDRQRKILRARDLATGVELQFPYDKLVLAMGASAVKPPIPGADLQGVHHLKSMEDAAAVAEAVAAKPKGSAVVIGAGFIGIEAVEALVERRWSVALLERYDQVFPGALDPEFAGLVQDKLEERMVEVETGAEVVRIEGEEGRVRRVVTKTTEYDADLVIMAAGVRPNVDIARDAGLEIGETGALAVNEFMQTSDPDIYAGGDLVQNRHLASGRACFAPLGSTANKHGRVIGDNVCGGASRFAGISGTFICKVFYFNAGATGLTEAKAAAAGLDFYTANASGMDIAHYYQGAQAMAQKLVIERGTDRVLGYQAIGGGDTARRIDVVATAIRFGATIDQLADLDLAYAPPYAQAVDCLLHAANAARNKRDGVMKGISPAEARALLQADKAAVIDVRGEMEYKRMGLPARRSYNIPVVDLPARVAELPRDLPLIAVCTVGLRGYAAQKTLDAAGFADVRVLEGGLFQWPWKDELQ